MFFQKNNKDNGEISIGSSRGQSSATASISDNRPQAVSQRKLQAIAVASPRNQKVAQLATSISYQTEKFDIDGTHSLDLGKAMHAVLDPEDPVKGSAPGDSGAEAALNAAVRYPNFNPTLDRAHLLHHDLGGFGVNANLYPMTGIANRAHERLVESPVQEALHTQRQVVNYRVVVRSNGARSVAALQTGGTTTFDCVASYANGQNIVNASIVSAPATNNPDKPPSDTKTQDLPGDWKFGGFKTYSVRPEWIHHDNVDAVSYGWSRNGSTVERKGEVGGEWQGYQTGGKIAVSPVAREMLIARWSDTNINAEILRLIQLLRDEVNRKYALSQNLGRMLGRVNNLINEPDFSLATAKSCLRDYLAEAPADESNRDLYLSLSHDRIFFWPSRTLESLSDMFYEWENPRDESQDAETSKMDEGDW